MRRIPFGAALLALGLVAFGLRVLYAEHGHYGAGLSDDFWYHLMANALASGHGFVKPLHPAQAAPTALHPPLFPALLAVASKLGLTTYGAQRVAGCAIASVTVPVLGLVGRHVGGRTLGLVAALVATVYLPLIANDSVLMSESLFGLAIAATILAALRFVERPTWRRAAWLGVAIGLATLTRSEAILLLVLLVPFAARRARVRPWRNALIVVAASAVVIAPWCVRNTLAFHRPVGVTTGDGPALAGANTRATYHGELIGTWDFGGLAIARHGSPEDPNEARDAERLRASGLRYARRNAGRLALVMPARVLRTWSVYPLDPAAKVRYTALAEKRRRSVEWVTLVSAWAAIALAVMGAIGLRRRGVWLAPYWSMAALATIVSALFYGGVRFREAADVAIVVLAAVALVDLAARFRGRRVSAG